MPCSDEDVRWWEVESLAYLSEVQDLIREEIREGTIRVRPKPDGSIRIVPVPCPEFPRSTRCKLIKPSDSLSQRRLVRDSAPKP
jgi:hypothetical protein